MSANVTQPPTYPFTDAALKALSDDQAAVLFEKVATPGAIRALSAEKALAIFKVLTDKANHGLSDEDALTIAAKLTARHASAKDRGDQERTNEGS